MIQSTLDSFVIHDVCQPCDTKKPNLSKTWETRRNNLPYEKSFASHPKAKCVDLEHPDNEGIDLCRLSMGSNKFLTLFCEICNHHYKQNPQAMTRKKKRVWRESGKRWKNDGPRGCPYCAHQKLCNDDTCQFCHDNSCANVPWLLQSWSSNNKNTPRQTFKTHKKPVEVKCCVCSHTFKVKPSNVKGDGGCRFCANQERCKDPNCEYCNKKKFSAHPKAIYWSKNNEDTPDDVAMFSYLTRLFDCLDCGHKDIPMIISNITKHNQWCGYCSIPRKHLCGKDDCTYCIAGSIASLPQSVYWDYEKNGDLKPYDVCRGTDKKYWFKCPECNISFQISGSSLSAGCFCSTCYRKTEGKVYNELIKYHPTLIREFSEDWCRGVKSGRRLRFDFCIKEKTVIIELDGAQHFKDVVAWKSSFEDQHMVDIVKHADANDNGFRVIRIIQEDVWSDKYDWLTELLNNIEDNTKQNIFMCKNGEYDFFIESMNFITSEDQHQPYSTSSPS